MKLPGLREIDRKIRHHFIKNGTKIFYPEQFLTDDLSLQDVLRVFRELEYVAKLELTVDVWIDGCVVWSGSPTQYIFKYFNGKYVEHTTCIRAEITPEYADELKVEIELSYTH